MAELLIDTQPLVLHLTEADDGTGKIRFKGEFGRVDKPTANNRFYSPRLMERELKRLFKPISEKKVLGELDHPADGRTRLQRVSHIITDLHIARHQVMGEAIPLNTPNGRILSALAEAGVAVGVSSRGFGSTNPRPDGVEEVADDYRLDTYDFVFQPADETAYPGVYTEEKQLVQDLEDGTMELTLEMLKEQYPDLVEMVSTEVRGTLLSEEEGNRSRAVNAAVAETESRIERKLKEKFSADIRKHVERVQEQAVEQARSEAASDPKVAGAVGLVENIAAMVAPFGAPVDQREAIEERDEKIADLEAKLAERELEVQSANAKSEEMKSLAKEAAYALRIEKKLRSESDERRKAVINLMGDLTAFESKEAIDERFDAVCSELDSAKPEHEEVTDEERDDLNNRISSLEKAQADMKAEAEAAAAEVEAANDRTQRALDAADKGMARAYAEGIAKSHPKGEQLLKLTENSVNVTEVNEVLETLTEESGDGGGERRLDEDEAEKIRRRLARGKERDLEEDTNGSRASDGKGGNGHDTSGDNLLEAMGLEGGEFDRLAGRARQ